MGEGILRPPFPRVDGELRCGQLSAAELADRFGTPLYVYDFEYIAARVAAFQAAFATADMLMAYSVKANGNVNLLRRLHALGCGADITSLGELLRARKAGIPAEQIVFGGQLVNFRQRLAPVSNTVAVARLTESLPFRC